MGTWLTSASAGVLVGAGQAAPSVWAQAALHREQSQQTGESPSPLRTADPSAFWGLVSP